MEEKQAKSLKDIWNLSSEPIETTKKNNDIKQPVISGDLDKDKVAGNVKGYVINNIGNIVAQFGFFIEDTIENLETINLKISTDGFLGKIYNENINIILGYGHPIGFNGLVDPKLTQILRLGPDIANGEDIIISIPNDEMLQERGVIIIIRDIDVDINLLSDEIRERFKQNLKDASEEITDLNDLEESYNSYMKHLYVLLSENYNNDDENKPEEEEFYE